MTEQNIVKDELRKAIESLTAKREEINATLANLKELAKGSPLAAKPAKKKVVMTPEQRAKISDAQKRRWAKKNGESQEGGQAA